MSREAIRDPAALKDIIEETHKPKPNPDFGKPVNFVPAKDMYVIEVMAPEAYSGSLLIPGQNQRVEFDAVVVAVPELSTTERQFSIGDKIAFSPFGGANVTLRGHGERKFKVLHEKEVYGCYESQGLLEELQMPKGFVSDSLDHAEMMPDTNSGGWGPK